MFRRLDHRVGHYALLLVVWLLTCLPNLGTPSLWDVDEGHNAEASREMLASGNWVVPTFNFQLRVDKPALLYWLQIAAFQVFGVNEFAARLPSALAALLALLTLYELGRQLFCPVTGLLAGVVLASVAMFCGAARFANPDALLCALTLLTLVSFWRGFACSGRGWFVTTGACAGFAVLAKGPVGLVLPAAVVVLFLLWSRELGRLWDRRLWLGLVVFALVALPWYAMVGAETKADFLRGFLLKHNVSRFLTPMENHTGPPWYYLLVLAVGFAPWSVFFAPTAWVMVRDWRDGPTRPALRFLVTWIGVWFVFFSLASTKLPNYILPLAPAMALLVARCLISWQAGQSAMPRWLMPAAIVCLACTGLAVSTGLLVASGTLAWQGGRTFPGLENWAYLGVLPVLAALGAGWGVWRQRRAFVLNWTAVLAVLFVGSLAAMVGPAVDRFKAPRPLVAVASALQPDREIRIGCLDYYQPSLVFYCQREVERLADAAKALEFLEGPFESYLFVPANVWESLGKRETVAYRVLGRQPDLYRGRDIVVVTNR